MTFLKDYIPWNKGKTFKHGSGLRKICPVCGIEFKAKKYSVNCSRACRNKANPINYTEERREKHSKACKGINAGDNNPMYGKSGELSPTWRENSPLWNGGSSFFPYSLDWSKQLKNKIRERDDYTCMICGNEGKDVHHINYNKEDCSENNLITLCRSCHMKTNHNRSNWIKYFEEEIINDK